MKKQILTKDSIIKQTGDVVASEIDGETVMMSIENGEYYGLDGIGSHIWELIRKRIKVSDLIDCLMKKYEVDFDTCEKDVMAFLNELNQDNILVVKN